MASKRRHINEASRGRAGDRSSPHAQQAMVERLARAVGAARIGIFEWDLATDRVHWTDQHALLLGVRAQPASTAGSRPYARTSEHVYRDWADRVHPDDLPRVEAELRRCRAGRLPYECEYRVIWTDGSVRWLAGRGDFEYDAAGAAQSMLGTVMDITDRKLAEQGLIELNATLERRIAERTVELEAARQRSAAIIDAAFDAIVTIDREGSIVDCNPAARRMFGGAADELSGRSLLLLLPGLHEGETAAGRDAPGGATLRLVRDKTSQHSARRLDGSRFPVNVSFGEISDLGLDVCIIRDVTEQRALQREILRISTLEQRRIGQELHDGVLQDLAGIGLLAEGLSDALREASSPSRELAARLASEVAAVNRAVRLLAEGLVPVAVNASGLVRALRGLARTTENRHGLRCEFSLSGGTPEVDDDVATHIYRIAREAVTNAVKHAEARSVQIHLERGKDTIRLEVCDDGIGMQPDRPPSSGLGLRTMRYRCALMGGKYMIGPRARGGTRISCVIPSQEASE